MNRILVTRKLPSSVLGKLEAAGAVDLHADDGVLSPDELCARVPGAHAIVSMMNDQINKAVLDAATELRVVANVAAGYDNIDVGYARSKGVIVTNTPDVLTESVADFTWALILAITRRLSEGERVVRRHAWKGWAFDSMLVPHLGSGTTETRTGMADLAVENVVAVLSGRDPLTPVRA